MHWIAHRGGAALKPENTLAAFADAIARGADGAELDVQLSHDGEVVVFHDFRLSADICRDAAGNWLASPAARVADVSTAALRSLDVGRARPGSAYARAHPLLEACDGEVIPLLAEVIELARGASRRFELFIDLKLPVSSIDASAAEDLARHAVAVVQKHDFVERAVFVGFDWRALLRTMALESAARCWFTTLPQSWFRDGDPPPEDEPPFAHDLSLLRDWVRNGASPWAAGFDAVKFDGSVVEAIKEAGGEGWFPYYRDATPGAIAKARRLGLAVGAWTVNDPNDMQSLVATGIDAICTDRTDLMAAASEAPLGP